jgi:hypothetical protein
MDSFNAKNWIEANIGGAPLRPETYQTLASFTILWNYFEQTKCGTRAEAKALRSAARSIGESGVLNDELKKALDYWRHRYVTGGATNVRFDTLHFRNGDNRKAAEAAVLGTATDPRVILEGLLVIAFRLRNNLFHGLKEFSELNDQRENLAMGCSALAGAIRILGG